MIGKLWSVGNIQEIRIVFTFLKGCLKIFKKQPHVSHKT